MGHSLIQRDSLPAVYQRSGPTDRHSNAKQSSPGTLVGRRRIHKATNASYFQRFSIHAGNPTGIRSRYVSRQKTIGGVHE